MWWGFALFVVVMLTVYVGGFEGPLLPQQWVGDPTEGWTWKTALSFTATALIGWFCVCMWLCVSV